MPVALTIVGMAAHMVYIAFWGFAIWDVSAQTVQQMAQAADRHLWPGGWWRLHLIGGLLWMALMTGWALWRLGQSLFGSGSGTTP
ncbi:MAG TPA: hypothetical protein VFB38_20150 [Chthonomonadaceae bacterium]|nr:hypothetical protein [Chthonomonadaceae bacterium]